MSLKKICSALDSWARRLDIHLCSTQWKQNVGICCSKMRLVSTVWRGKTWTIVCCVGRRRWRRGWCSAGVDGRRGCPSRRSRCRRQHQAFPRLPHVIAFQRHNERRCRSQQIDVDGVTEAAGDRSNVVDNIAATVSVHMYLPNCRCLLQMNASRCCWNRCLGRRHDHWRWSQVPQQINLDKLVGGWYNVSM